MSNKIYAELKDKLYFLTNEDHLEEMCGSDRFLIDFTYDLIAKINASDHFYLYKYTAINENTLDSIVNKYIYLNYNGNFNDAFEGIPGDDVSLYEEALIKSPEIGKYACIHCFTEDKNNMAMWGHYGNESKGICIEYDLKKLNEDSLKNVLKHLFPVVYTTERNTTSGILLDELKESIVKFNASNDSIDNDTINYISDSKQVFLFKDETWKYENEWRLVFMITDDIIKRHGQKLPFDCISSIVLGPKISDTSKNLIVKICESMKDNVEIKQAKYVNYQFKYTYEPVQLK